MWRASLGVQLCRRSLLGASCRLTQSSPILCAELTHCPQCKQSLGEPNKCPHCDWANHFELFGLPLEYNLSETKLVDHVSRKRKEIESGGESVEQSNEVENAYQTLSSPIKRAQHLLDLLGHALESYVPDTEFFSMITHLQEDLDQKDYEEDVLLEILEYSSRAAVHYRNHIAKQFAQSPLPAVEIGHYIGRLEWTFKIMQQITLILEKHKKE